MERRLKAKDKGGNLETSRRLCRNPGERWEPWVSCGKVLGASWKEERRRGESQVSSTN